MTDTAVKIMRAALRSQKARKRQTSLYRSRKRSKPQKDRPLYQKCWRIVEGVALDLLAIHPEYFNIKNQKAMRISLAKRAASKLEELCLVEAKSRGIDSTIESSQKGMQKPKLL